MYLNLDFLNFLANTIIFINLYKRRLKYFLIEIIQFSSASKCFSILRKYIVSFLAKPDECDRIVQKFNSNNYKNNRAKTLPQYLLVVKNVVELHCNYFITHFVQKFSHARASQPVTAL